MFFDRHAQILVRSTETDGMGGVEETWTPLVIGEEESPALWPCKWYSKAGVALRKPFGIDPEFSFIVIGPVIDASLHVFAVRDRLIIDGTTFEIERAEICHVMGPHHQRLFLKQV